jgi:hypothetical protein
MKPVPTNIVQLSTCVDPVSNSQSQRTCDPPLPINRPVCGGLPPNGNKTALERDRTVGTARFPCQALCQDWLTIVFARSRTPLCDREPIFRSDRLASRHSGEIQPKQPDIFVAQETQVAAPSHLIYLVERSTAGATNGCKALGSEKASRSGSSTRALEPLILPALNKAWNECDAHYSRA